MARIRLKDIAAATGFSTNTVSLALRGSPLVAPETKEAILKVARSLSYRPNEIAKSLVQRQTRTVGLILTNIVNPILTQTAQAAESALTRRGYTTLFATSSNLIENEMRALDTFSARQVDGVLAYPTNHGRLDHLAELHRSGTPVVLMAAKAPPGLDAVRVDERLGAARATRHLIRLGHRRIGMIDSGVLVGNVEKAEGFSEALAEHGMSVPPELLCRKRGNSVAVGREGMAELMALPEPPTAVFASNDMFAIGAMDWCTRNGLRVPEQVSVIGFDNIEFAAHACPPLTTMGYDPRQLAELAVERLLHLVESAEPQAADPRILQPEIVLRSSTAPVDNLPVNTLSQ